MPYVPLAAGRVHYAERGERAAGRPSSLLIHGAGAGAALWSMVLARVARHTHAVAIDLPGHGPSEVGARPLTLERYRDAVGALAAALCLGPSVLVGHSLGALVALAAALAWPDKVRALVLCAAAPKMTVDPEVFRLLRNEPERFVPWLADHALSPRAKPAVKRAFLAAAAPTPPEIAADDFQIVRATDFRADLANVTCPITWVDGADDRIVPPELREGRRGQIVTVPSAGHLLPIEAPAAIAETAATLRP
ncbi:MAG TPA: alpha/beta fold hydrolase [Polyangia bacterium]|jgi:pimeloyl-ACP methyl ester carboxylesterase|nr:alpha/beta fold hydrolase [Polyangia bacterium]